MPSPESALPDWKKLVRERISSSTSSAPSQEEVVSELAAHLEEAYEDALSQGLTAEAATEFALQEVPDWHVLVEKIQHAKSEHILMNRRTKTLWLPAMVTLFGSSGLLMLIQRLGFQPRLIWVAHTGMLFYWPWLASLPIFGALGGYLSLRAQGSLYARLAAGLSPALLMLTVMCLILPWGLAIDGFTFFRLIHFGIGLTNWVALPAVALLLGTAPFLHERTPDPHIEA